MLTYKSKISCFKKYETLDYDKLKRLCDSLILADRIHFTCDRVGGGFPEGIAQVIVNKINTADKNCSILIFNDLSLILYNMLRENGYNNIYICYHDFSDNDDSAIVCDIMKDYISINFVEAEEILSRSISYEEVLNMDKKFDYIISNPPYAIGNQVTKAIVEDVDFEQMVNLMPASKYKGGKLYEHVSQLESAEDDFEDAAVGDSLTVAIIEKEIADVYHSYDEFENEKRDPRFQEFYKLNASKKSHSIIWESFGGTRLDSVPPVETGFMITLRTVLDGTHNPEGKGAADLKFNLENLSDYIPFDKANKNYSCSFLNFDSNLTKHNFCRFWYYNALMNNLIKGLNKTSGTCRAAIPNIDWSIERDYEHLTLEDIMNILRDEK